MGLVVLRCPSGIAGNLWMAALLGLGADPAPLDDLPARLGVPFVSIAWRRSADESEVVVHGAEASEPARYADLRRAVHGAGLEPPLVDDALRVLDRRERAEAAFLDVDVDRRVYRGEDVADTLVDVVGGLLLWHGLGRPRVTTDGPLALGGRVRSSSAGLVGNLPTGVGHPAFELTTPTGAALLGDRWERVASDQAAAPPRRRVRVPGDFSRAAGLPPLEAVLVG